MKHSDKLTNHYSELIEGSYDCMDRIVLNGYFPLLHTPGGFRTWYRRLFPNEEKLTTNELMRFAGRGSRRLRAFCKSKNVPLVYFKTGERKHQEAEKLMPKDKGFEGLFAVFVSKAPSKLWEVKKFDNGSIDLRRKKEMSLVNHYFFHIMDKAWGHVTIKMCAHPPFTCQIILNGHEWVERRKEIKTLEVTKVDNCFTAYRDGKALSKVADTLKQKGQLEKVCNRWIYRCLWFILDKQEQKSSGFVYQYSVYQAEYSRNLLFYRGTQLDKIYQHLIDLTRSNLDIRKLKTIFGIKYRPHHRKMKAGSGLEVQLEKPDYNLTIFKIHFGAITLKLYDKGERTLRSEVVVHNSKALKCKRGLDSFTEIIQKLQQLMQTFMNGLQYAHVSLIGEGDLEKLTTPTQKGSSRLAGLDISKKRIRNVLATVLALSIKPGGYIAKDVSEIMQQRHSKSYTARNAGYDLRKLRGKKLIEKLPGSRKYKLSPTGSQQIMALLVLIQKQLPMMLACMSKEADSHAFEKPLERIEECYFNIAAELKALKEYYGIKFAA